MKNYWHSCLNNQLINYASCKLLGFCNSSVSKESACNAGDPGLIPGLGRSACKGIGYPLQYSWASLVAQLVKNLPAMQETSVWSLGWEDPLEEEKATHSSILAWRIPWTVSPWGCKGLDTTEQLSLDFFTVWATREAWCWRFLGWIRSLEGTFGKPHKYQHRPLEF